MSSHVIFVYGTLKQGFYNHFYLEDAEHLGIHITEPVYTMVSLEHYPAVIPTGSTSIHGELYRIDQETFYRIDELEGYPIFYSRIQIDTGAGKAWMYVIDEVLENPIVESGVW